MPKAPVAKGFSGDTVVTGHAEAHQNGHCALDDLHRVVLFVSGVACPCPHWRVLLIVGCLYAFYRYCW